MSSYNGLTISKGGKYNYLSIYEGDSASNITINASGDWSVHGGNVTNITINASGRLYAFGGNVTNLTINASGQLYAGGGNITNITINKGGRLDYCTADPKISTLTIKKGGIVNDLVFNSDAKLKNISKISHVTVLSGHKAYIDCGDTVSDVTVSGNKTKLDVRDGTVTKAVIGSGAKLTARERSKVTNVTVKKGGTLKLKDGATASSITVDKGGLLNISVGNNKASNITLRKGGTINGFSWAKEMKFKSFSNKISNAGIESGKEAWITGKQTLSGFTVSGKGTRLIVEEGATASKITVKKGSELVMASGGKATNITVKKGGIINGITFKSDTKYASAADFLNKKLADTTDDTWKAVSRKKAILTGKEISGWVGLKDAKDFIKIQIQKTGKLSLELDDSAEDAFNDGKLKFSLLDSSGKAIKLATIDDNELMSKTVLKKGAACYLGVSCASKNYYTDYGIKTGVIASA